MRQYSGVTILREAERKRRPRNTSAKASSLEVVPDSLPHLSQADLAVRWLPLSCHVAVTATETHSHVFVCMSPTSRTNPLRQQLLSERLVKVRTGAVLEIAILLPDFKKHNF